ncbi:hypothetical protein [Thalassovita taeanensis]|uniref:Uncharacterized protein n=1 Tax=Thalassovita taeanensis TaxID=657014 RepID=A0A1H9AXP7_9RHOB|nr:hypothetical protein [Thalassovita taeanensis]SEP81231.1 hypothetical protein SAMN04488092_102293 [Thalassovita taeanensis]
MQKQKRWMKSAIETSKAEMPALPWARGNRRLNKAAAKPGKLRTA